LQKTDAVLTSAWSKPGSTEKNIWKGINPAAWAYTRSWWEAAVRHQMFAVKNAAMSEGKLPVHFDVFDKRRTPS
jgi:hypothetical protein